MCPTTVKYYFIHVLLLAVGEGEGVRMHLNDGQRSKEGMPDCSFLWVRYWYLGVPVKLAFILSQLPVIVESCVSVC